MGKPKPLLTWDGLTLVEWQVGQLRAAGADHVVVVVGSHADEVRGPAASAGAIVVTNEAYREGRATSLRAGALAAPDDADAVVVLNVDQPRPAWVTRTLLDRWRESQAALVVPRAAGRGGHPIVVHGRLLGELRRVEEESLGLRALTERHKDVTATVEFENPCVSLDLNTPAEYERALASYLRGEWDS
jgi:CTP:molybdopterin cytidylyltransferase MocA